MVADEAPDDPALIAIRATVRQLERELLTLEDALDGLRRERQRPKVQLPSVGFDAAVEQSIENRYGLGPVLKPEAGA